jgi:hypothetical protein
MDRFSHERMTICTWLAPIAISAAQGVRIRQLDPLARG